MFEDFYTEEDMGKIRDLLVSGKLNGWWHSHWGGTYLQEFERKMSEYLGVRYCLGVSSGTAAVYLALKSVASDGYVLVSPYTHIGTVAPILLAGAKPFFVDCDLHGNIDPIYVKEALDNHPNHINAIIAEHNLGTPCNMTELKEVADEYHIPIIEDCSQALGAEYKGKKAGSLGKVSAFSLGGDMTKTISLGEGGIVATNDDRVVEMVNDLRNHGDKESKRPFPCFNFRLSDIQALLGVIQYKTIKFQLAWQKMKAKIILEELPFLDYPKIPKESDPAYYIIGTLYNGAKTRDEYLQIIRKLGITESYPRKAVGPGYSTLINELPVYRDFPKTPLNRCYQLKNRSVWIDWHRYPTTDTEIFVMVKLLKEAENC